MEQLIFHVPDNLLIIWVWKPGEKLGKRLHCMQWVCKLNVPFGCIIFFWVIVLINILYAAFLKKICIAVRGRAEEILSHIKRDYLILSLLFFFLSYRKWDPEEKQTFLEKGGGKQPVQWGWTVVRQTLHTFFQVWGLCPCNLYVWANWLFFWHDALLLTCIKALSVHQTRICFTLFSWSLTFHLWDLGGTFSTFSTFTTGQSNNGTRFYPVLCYCDGF